MNLYLLPLVFVLTFHTSLCQYRPREKSEFFERIANGATCMYKIADEYRACNEKQQKRLDNESRQVRSYTYNDQEKQLQEIACCAFWEFLDCIQETVNVKCKPNEWYEVKKYTEQLGSAVPSRICYSDYPRNACKFPTWGIIGIAIAAVIVLLVIVAIVCIACVQNN